MRLHIALAAAALALASTDLMAYQIIASHYHVEVEPDKFVDQLVLRCEDGKEITVPWQSKLAESCGEDLMGNVSRSQPKSAAAPADEQQKQAMLKQLHGHYNNMPDQNVEFNSGPDGLSAHFTPPMVEILKKYEACRKTHKDKAYCATERDRAMAALSDAPAADAAATSAKEAAATPAKETVPAPVKKPGGRSKRAQAAATQPAQPVPQPTAAEEPRGDSPAPAATASEPAALATTTAAAEAPPLAAAATPSSPPNDAAPTAPVPAAKPSDADARASAEKKIGEDYAACMRNKPKFECEEARSKALVDLDRGNKPAKSARSHKRASRDTTAQPVASK
jgi:hypothetical protein